MTDPARTLSGWTTGILGQSWRATVTPWGDVLPWDESTPLTWAVAADDRWHFPERETSTRQTLVSGTPVVETRVRVPNGDVVQRVWSAASGTGASAILMEFTNDSPMPIAISLSRPDVVTPRVFHRLGDDQRPWPSQDRGIDRPPVVIPLGHRAQMRIALPCRGRVVDDDVDSFPGWESVARGWLTIADAASLVEMPESVDGVPLGDIVRAVRLQIALGFAREERSLVESDAAWIVARRELLRMGLEDPDVPDVVSALERILRHARKVRRVDPFVADALRAGALLLAQSDRRALDDLTRAVARTMKRCGLDERGTRDLARLLRACPVSSRGDIVRWRTTETDVIGIIESEIAQWSAVDEVTLIPGGFETSQLGVDFEARRIPAGPGRSVSLAIRWHAERPAVIWEVDGPPGLLLRSGSDPSWTSVEPSGEALWGIPWTDVVAH